MLKKLYDKSKIWFAVAWIVVYCVSMSAGDGVSAALGVEKSVSLAVGLLLSAVLVVFLKKHGLFKAYGLCRSSASMGAVAFYAPLVLMLTANLWHGVTLRYGVTETVLYILTMFCVGFLEEVVFRGLLFNAMREESLKAAVIVSSLTFGIGHIINLFNGSGAELIPNLLQVVYATAAGFMFVMLYCKSGSLLVCIAAHGLFNALSVFAAQPTLTGQIVSCAALTVITGGYGAYLALSENKKRRPA